MNFGVFLRQTYHFSAVIIKPTHCCSCSARIDNTLSIRGWKVYKQITLKNNFLSQNTTYEMRTSIPISLILIPTVGALVLFLYGILSDRWVRMDMTKVEYTERDRIPSGLIVISKRIAFLKNLGLFSKCIEYRWLNVVDINSTNINQLHKSSKMCMRPCRSGEIRCGSCCVSEQNRCDHIPECETLDDEMNCKRLFNDHIWLDERRNCFRHRINIFNLKAKKRQHDSPRYFYSSAAYLGPPSVETQPQSSDSNNMQYENQDYYYPSLNSRAPSEHFLHGIMVWLLPCQNHLSIPFTCTAFLCVLGFLCGVAAIGLFLWNWVHRKIYMTSFQYHGSYSNNAANLLLSNAVIHRLNPWLSSIEVLDVSFYITCGAVFLCLMTTIISLLFFCGVIAGSRFSFEKGRGNYEIVKILPYEDHYVKS
ncbi:hypothetical protein GJ496_009871 [Pomphorhynchus laevis]|nr:hypothetical protein GJ496_009871 [Pomphorhynchus laevis]